MFEALQEVAQYGNDGLAQSLRRSSGRYSMYASDSEASQARIAISTYYGMWEESQLPRHNGVGPEEECIAPPPEDLHRLRGALASPNHSFLARPTPSSSHPAPPYTSTSTSSTSSSSSSSMMHARRYPGMDSAAETTASPSSAASSPDPRSGKTPVRSSYGGGMEAPTPGRPSLAGSQGTVFGSLFNLYAEFCEGLSASKGSNGLPGSSGATNARQSSSRVPSSRRSRHSGVAGGARGGQAGDDDVDDDADSEWDDVRRPQYGGNGAGRMSTHHRGQTQGAAIPAGGGVGVGVSSSTSSSSLATSGQSELNDTVPPMMQNAGNPSVSTSAAGGSSSLFPSSGFASGRGVHMNGGANPLAASARRQYNKRRSSSLGVPPQDFSFTPAYNNSSNKATPLPGPSSSSSSSSHPAQIAPQAFARFSGHSQPSGNAGVAFAALPLSARSLSLNYHTSPPLQLNLASAAPLPARLGQGAPMSMMGNTAGLVTTPVSSSSSSSSTSAAVPSSSGFGHATTHGATGSPLELASASSSSMSSYPTSMRDSARYRDFSQQGDVAIRRLESQHYVTMPGASTIVTTTASGNGSGSAGLDRWAARSSSLPDARPSLFASKSLDSPFGLDGAGGAALPTPTSLVAASTTSTSSSNALAGHAPTSGHAQASQQQGQHQRGSSRSGTATLPATALFADA